MYFMQDSDPEEFWKMGGGEPTRIPPFLHAYRHEILKQWKSHESTLGQLLYLYQYDQRDQERNPKDIAITI